MDEREKLRRDNLILGSLGRSSLKKEVVFVVPIASRPVDYDAPNSSKVSTISYGDDQLFLDAGYLLGSLSSALPGRAIRESVPLEQAFAIVDFVHPEDRCLFLTPGIEKVLTDMPGAELLERYIDRIRAGFPDRIAGHEEKFAEGFFQTRERS